MLPSAVVIANFVQACCWQVDRVPERGETRRALGFQTEPGGKGLNVAIALQRLGLQVIPVLAHGQDGAGAQLRELLQREGLDLTHVHALPMPSGWGMGLIEPGGHNRITVFPGANDHLGPAEVALAQPALTQATLVYGHFEVAFAAVETAMALAHAAGVRTVLNASPWQPLSRTLRESVHTHLVNASEATQLLGMDVTRFDDLAPAELADAPQWQAELGPAVAAFWADCPAAQTLTITLGAAGALAWTRGQALPCLSPGLPLHGAGDTVGCGDAFAAAFCWAVTQGAPLQLALHAGNLCGAHLASHPGVLEALPHHQWLSKALGGFKTAN